MINKQRGKLTAAGYFAFYVNGELLTIKRNMIMDALLNSHANTLLGTAADVEIAYVAIGDSTTAVTAADTTLGNETSRYALTSAVLSAVGKIESVFTIQKTEGNGTIEEVGIFGGAAASATPDSGTLLARVLWHHVKTSSEELQIQRIDLIGRAT